MLTKDLRYVDAMGKARRGMPNAEDFGSGHDLLRAGRSAAGMVRKYVPYARRIHAAELSGLPKKAWRSPAWNPLAKPGFFCGRRKDPGAT